MVLNKLVLFILIFSIHFTYSQKVNWFSFEQAVELQKTNPKNIMMDVYHSVYTSIMIFLGLVFCNSTAAQMKPNLLFVNK